MITPVYARTMAAYNRWQNRSLYGAADGLSDERRREACGAYFGSIHGTLNHLLWADQMWLSRLADLPTPKAKSIKDSVAQYEGWADLRTAREAFDGIMIDWAERLDAAALAGDLTWFSAAAQREVTKPRALIIAHVFNHQTHHRGQVHCMLTQSGAKPADTDLPMLR